MEAFYLMRCIIMKKHSNQINTLWWNKEKEPFLCLKPMNGYFSKQWRHRGNATESGIFSEYDKTIF